jgi:hypothetical protein
VSSPPSLPQSPVFSSLPLRSKYTMKPSIAPPWRMPTLTIRVIPEVSISLLSPPSPPFGPTFVTEALEADAFRIVKIEQDSIMRQKVIYYELKDLIFYVN